MVIVHLGSGRDLKIRGYRCFSRWQKHVQKHSNNDFTENKLRYVFIQVVSTYTLLIYIKKPYFKIVVCVCSYILHTQSSQIIMKIIFLLLRQYAAMPLYFPRPTNSTQCVWLDGVSVASERLLCACHERCYYYHQTTQSRKSLFSKT